MCIGAAKAGTSWLYETLAGHPDVHFRAVKEVHFFDAVDFDQRAQNVERLRKVRDGITARLAADDGTMSLGQIARKSARAADIDACIHLLETGESDADYLAYLDEGRGDARLIGDITPAYSLLSVSRLEQMARMLADVRFVYILRDPVERLWSHVRMIASRRAAGAEADLSGRASRILARTIRGQERQIDLRSDYVGALSRLIQAVQPAKRLVMFYEDMTRPGGLKPLAQFLGLEALDGAPIRVHEGPGVPMTKSQRHAAATWLAPQYEFVAKEIGRVPANWRQHMAEV